MYCGRRHSPQEWRCWPLVALSRNERPSERGFGYFEDAIEEFSHWYGFSPKYLRDREREERQERAQGWRERQAALPDTWRTAGRNEPCPCGSGRKYKKCCLGKSPAAVAGPA